MAFIWNIFFDIFYSKSRFNNVRLLYRYMLCLYVVISFSTMIEVIYFGMKFIRMNENSFGCVHKNLSR